jgi:hypothetical protein
VLTGTAAATVAAALIFALLWFEPWQLLVNTTVNEAVPSGITHPSASGGPAEVPGEATPPGSKDSPEAPGVTAPTGPRILSTSAFRNLEHPTSGTATILELSDGQRFVRLEDFRTSSGPDVIVILSSTPSTEESLGAYDDGSLLILGELKGNIGNQNYEIPAGTDLSGYRSIVIWCRRFKVGFGAASIEL